MQTKLSIEAKAFAALFALLSISVLLVPFWHIAPQVVFSAKSFSLQEYQTVLYRGEKACTKIDYIVPGNIPTETIQFRFFSGNIPLLDETVKVGGENETKLFCFDPSALPLGDNLIEILASGNTLFYHMEKLDSERPPAPVTIVDSFSPAEDTVEFTVRNFDDSYYKPLEIFVNGKLDHRVYPAASEQGFSERVAMQPGANSVGVFFEGKQRAGAYFEKPSQPLLPFPLGLLLLVLGFAVFACFVFSKHDIAERLALATGAVLVVLIVLVFALNYAGLLSFYSVAGCFTVIVAALAFACRKNFSQTFSKDYILETSPIIGLALVLFFIVPVFFQLFSFTDITYWNKFYERQGALIYESNSIPTTDDLSYFGRSYSFSPGYFILEAGVHWIAGVQGTQLFALMLGISNALLFFSLFFFGRALGLSNKKNAILALFTGMSGFILGAMTYSPRHVLSFALLALALGCIIKRRHPAITGVFLGIMSFVQLPLLLFFPLFYIIVAKKIEWGRLAKTMVIAGAAGLMLLLPNLLLYGMPTQASSEEWGYLINYDLYYWFIDITAPLVFLALFFGADLLRRKIEGGAYTIRLFLGFLFGTVLQLTVVFRWNILTATNLALLVAFLFPESKLKDNFVERLLVILMMVAYGFLLYGMSYLNVHEIVTTPISFVAENTSTSARILSDPMYGHDLTSVAGRAVLADLRVEYADQQKLDDAYRFLEDKDYSIISKYRIDYVANQVDYIHKQAIGGKKAYGILEFKRFDKIYSNGFIFIHRVQPGWEKQAS
ncbi:MAG: hypothetical protein NTW59_02960 [Candidatus Diapherotrites archaeon]|nr:hypothetical protein [Candidatus Diapherotrites archaeon]